MSKIFGISWALARTLIDLTDYSFFTQWSLFVLNTYWNLYTVKLNYNLVIEPEINQKQFRPGNHWNIISI